MSPAPPSHNGTRDYLEDGSRSGRDRSLELAQTVPTLLPDLLRRLSSQANGLATDPLNPLDNNPFITREWLIVSQVLHTAASDMEKRFAALFTGS